MELNDPDYLGDGLGLGGYRSAYGGSIMNDRQFAAAHDRYLEPPDDEPEGTPEDEMDLADIARQKRLDREDWDAHRARMKEDDDA